MSCTIVSASIALFPRPNPILLTRVVQDDLSIVWNSNCPYDVALASGVESASICSIKALEDTTSGQIEALAYVENTNNQDVDVVMNIYNGATLLHTETFTILKNEASIKITSFEIVSAITANDTIDFKLEAQGSDLTVRGTINPSQIQIKRIT